MNALDPHAFELDVVRYGASPVPGIGPHQGWTMLWSDYEDGDGFTVNQFFARGPRRDVRLDVSCYSFRASQERFNWLVECGFPLRPTPFGGWTSEEIDARILGDGGAA